MSKSHVALEEPQELPARQRETPESVSGDERRSPPQIARTGPAVAARSAPERELVDALRRFIQQEAGRAERRQPAPPRIGLAQAIVLLLLLLDAGLVYSFAERMVQTRLFQEALQILPWLLGPAWLAYADNLRQFLLNQIRHVKWVAPLAALFVPLLLAKTPVFAIRVRVPLQGLVTSTNAQVKVHPEESGLYRLESTLEGYEIEVTGPEDEKGYWIPFDITLSWFRVLRATASQLLRTGNRELALSPLYAVPTHSATDAQAEVESHQFQGGFFQKKPLDAARCKVATARRQDLQAAACQVLPNDSSLWLPPGNYDLAFRRNNRDCGPPFPYTVTSGFNTGAPDTREWKNPEIDLDKLCPK